MTSNLVASMPRRSSARVEIRTGPKAERFLCAVKAHAYRHAKALPLYGGERACQRKLDPDDTLAMSIHETTAVLAHFSDEIAADLTQALLNDAGKGSRISVSITTESLPSGDVRTMEREYAVLSSRFLADVDDALAGHHPDRKRMVQEFHGMVARAQMLMNPEREDS